jgi:hypothetical protein
MILKIALDTDGVTDAALRVVDEADKRFAVWMFFISCTVNDQLLSKLLCLQRRSRLLHFATTICSFLSKKSTRAPAPALLGVVSSRLTSSK